MPAPTPQDDDDSAPYAAVVGVSVDGSGNPVCDPDSLNLTGRPGAVRITFILQEANYRFPNESEDACYGIDIGSSSNSEFDDWYHADGTIGIGSYVDVVDNNNDGNWYNYTVQLINTATNARVRSDPSIEDYQPVR